MSSSFPGGSMEKRGTELLRVPLFHVEKRRKKNSEKNNSSFSLLRSENEEFQIISDTLIFI